jgi:cytosine/uracil/thiamine/allantoin permease
MPPSKRILIFGLVIEIGLAALGWFLISQLQSGAMQPTGTVEEASATILQVLGSVMGGLGGLLLVVYFVLRRKERAL